MERKRQNEISLFSVFLCFAVICIHAFSEVVSSGAHATKIYYPVMAFQRLFSLAVPAFVFLSGLRFMFAYGKADDFSPLRYILRRFARLLPLYAVWTAIYYAFRVFAYGYEFSAKNLLFGFLTGDTEAHLYFVPLILQFSLIAPISRALHRKFPAAFLIPAAMLFTAVFGENLPWLLGVLFPKAEFAYCDRIFSLYLVYWSAGCAVGNSYEKFRQALEKFRMQISFLFALGYAAELFAAYYTYVLKRAVPCFPAVHAAYSLAAAIFFLMLACMCAGKTESLPKPLQRLDGRAYFLYLSHIFPMLLVERFVFSYPLGLLERMAVRLIAMAIWTFAVAFIPETKVKKYK